MVPTQSEEITVELLEELMFLILAFLKAEKYTETVHKLEQELGFFFDMKYFEEKVLAGDWDEVEKYLSGFMDVDDNRLSIKIFFEIRKQKYLEALDVKDKAKAAEILVKDLKVFKTKDENIYKELTDLLSLDNFRENKQLASSGDTPTMRTLMIKELKKLIEKYPAVRDFPNFKRERLLTLINQGLNWEQNFCLPPRPYPHFATIPHMFTPTNRAHAATSITLPVGAVAYPAAHCLVTPTAYAPNPNALAGGITNTTGSSFNWLGLANKSSLSVLPNQVPILSIARTDSSSPGLACDINNDHEQRMRRRRPASPSIMNESATQHQQLLVSMDNIPITVACTFHQGSSVKGFDFHPFRQTLLLVGSANGEITLWEIGLRMKLVADPFRVWNMATCSKSFKDDFCVDPLISVSRVAWNPEGSYLGVAFTKHLIHLYAFKGKGQAHFDQVLEIDAHVGGVNDLAFTEHKREKRLVTCGDDKLIKIWDLLGRKIGEFQGHSAPVCSISPCLRMNDYRITDMCILSVATSGRIKAWMCDSPSSAIDDFSAPGFRCIRLFSNGHDTRFFCCGAHDDGSSFLVEWDAARGAIKRTYNGFETKVCGFVQFDTKNEVLAAGENHQIKFWDMNSVHVFTSTDAGGGLPSYPCVRFNKSGSLLAVSTSDNGFKILANSVAIKSLEVLKSRPVEGVTFFKGLGYFEGLSGQNEPSGSKKGSDPTIDESRFLKDAPVEGKSNKLTEIVDSSKCQVVTIPASEVVDSDKKGSNPAIDKSRTLEDAAADEGKPKELSKYLVVTIPASIYPPNKVARILYTNSGGGILVLDSNGIQKLWKWSCTDQNPNGKASASIVPRHCQDMMYDIPKVNLQKAVPCIALSRNDKFVVKKFMTPSPIPILLSFYPQDNSIVTIGVSSRNTYIYDVSTDTVKAKLKGHLYHITGLAFSSRLNIMVSSSEDGQLCMWNTKNWRMLRQYKPIMPAGKYVEFHPDQIRLLVFCETVLQIYDSSKSKLEVMQNWVLEEAASARLSCATYSCSGQVVYAAFCDGNVGVFDAKNLRLRCRISPSAYLPLDALNSSEKVAPVGIAAHPKEPNQFALGMIKITEPCSESDGWWWCPAQTVSLDREPD